MNPKITAAEAANLLNVSLSAIHKQLKVKNLSFSKSMNRIYFGYETARELFRYKFKLKIVAVQIVKGGTGKTSLVHSIAIKASLYGARVLCVDLDQQANLTQAFNIDSEELPIMVDALNENIDISNLIVNVSPGIDLIPSRIENAILDNTIMLKKLALGYVYKKRFDSIKNRYDLVLIDCPPALGQSVAAIALASDLIISPVTPEKFSLSGLKVTFKELKDLERDHALNISLKLVLNKFDTRTSLSHEILSTLIKSNLYGDKICKSYVRLSQEFPNSIANGTSIFDSLRNSSAKEDIDLLTKEILNINSSENEISLGRLEEIKKSEQIVHK